LIEQAQRTDHREPALRGGVPSGAIVHQHGPRHRSHARQIASSSPASTSSEGSSEVGVFTATQAGSERIHACTGAGVFGC
jgi:hypothetical protein